MLGHPLIRNWGTLILQGALAILIGLMLLFVPVTTLVTLVYFFAAFAIADGILALVSIFAPTRETSRWWLALYGAAGILIGLIVFAWPGLTALTFLYLVAVWAFLIGIFRIATAIALRQEIEGEWALLASGVLAVLFGLYVLFVPGALAPLILAIGIYAILKGILLIIGGVRLRSEQQRRMMAGEPGERGEPGGPGERGEPGAGGEGRAAA